MRQLANEVRRIVAMAEPGAPLTSAVLSPEILASRRTIPAATSAVLRAAHRLDQPLPAAVQALEQSMIRHALERARKDASRKPRACSASRARDCS